jgi:hypothetical protein
MAPKTFPITNMFFSSSGDLILYSSSQQRLWRLQNGKTTLTGEFDISTTLSPWSSLVQVLTDSLIFNDKKTILLLNKEDYSTINSCTFTAKPFDNTCFYVVKTRSLVQLRCDSTVTVYTMNPSASPQCTTETAMSDEFRGMNIWQDVFNSITNVMHRSLEPVNGFDAIFNPPFIDRYNYEFQIRPFMFKGYAASGLIFETMMGTPRALLDKNPGLSVRWAGDELYAAWALAPSPSCGPTPCFFDLHMGYNALNTRPYANAELSTWMDLLQTCINKQIALTNVKSLYAIRTLNNGASYRALINEFVSTFQRVSAFNEFKTTAINPDSNNIWMVKGESLFEISRSGVQSRFADGMCLPSNIALCPTCFWAESGETCRPCFFKNEASMAWKAFCSPRCVQIGLPGPSLWRRLLSTDQNGKVVFVLSGGNHTTFKQLWPNASFTSWGGNSTTIVLNSHNIQLTIADVNVKLTSFNNDTTVQVQPYGVESGTGVGTLVFVLNTTNKTLVQTLWPNAVLETSAMNTTVTLATTDDPDKDMRSLMIQLLKATNISVLVNPYLKLDLKDRPESKRTGTLVFVLNTTNKTLILTLWPDAVLETNAMNTTVKLATTEDPDQDMRALRGKLLRSGNVPVLVDPILIPDTEDNTKTKENGTDPSAIIGIIAGLFIIIGLCLLCANRTNGYFMLKPNQ